MNVHGTPTLARLTILFAFAAAAAACRAEGGMNARFSTSGNATESRETEPAAEAPAPAPPQQLSTPAAPPADACPLTCFEARGPVRASVTAEEQTQLRSALEPVLGRMRGCVSAEDWRRRGSPVIHLRIAPGGELAELGVDPHHGLASSCFEDAAKGASPGLSLPGRKAVRCAERCVRSDEGRPRRGRGRRGGNG
ncbi:MAG: hypothetical protein KF819_11230 [Labilithrix sp.]|nr:hypothetical protein [Labilithrix sp.]